MPQNIARQIATRIYRSGRGGVFTAKDFFDFASEKSAYMTLDRLDKKGTIRRLMRGVYEYPAYSKLLGGPASPPLDG